MYIFEQGFVHENFWIQANLARFVWGEVAEKLLVRQASRLYWISLKVEVVAGAGFEPTTFRL